MKYPARAWKEDNIRKVMYAVLILHNMIVEDKGRNICTYNAEDNLNPAATIQMGTPEFYDKMLAIYNPQTYHQLRHDLTEDLWANEQAGEVFVNDNEDFDY